MSNWVAVAAKPGEDKRALLNIRRQSFVYYQPVFYDRRCKIRRPLFGRYFFVDIGKDRNRWGAIHNTYGVLYVLCSNGNVTFIAHSEIAKIKQLENDNGVIELPDHPLFAQYPRKPKLGADQVWLPGQRVKITSGTFAGQIGLFEGQTIQQREAVMLSWLGRIMVAKEALEAA